ncbi:MAG: hypothetical protein ACKN81_09890 [Pirellulaceae bacterium]
MRRDQKGGSGPDHRSSRVGSWMATVMYLGGVALASGLMLMVNAAVVYSLYSGVGGWIPPEWNVTQLWQFLIYLVPMFLLVLEWMLWDLLMRRAGSKIGSRSRR